MILSDSATTDQEVSMSVPGREFDTQVPPWDDQELLEESRSPSSGWTRSSRRRDGRRVPGRGPARRDRDRQLRPGSRRTGPTPRRAPTRARRARGHAHAPLGLTWQPAGRHRRPRRLDRGRGAEGRLRGGRGAPPSRRSTRRAPAATRRRCADAAIWASLVAALRAAAAHRSGHASTEALAAVPGPPAGARAAGTSRARPTAGCRTATCRPRRSARRRSPGPGRGSGDLLGGRALSR